VTSTERGDEFVEFSTDIRGDYLRAMGLYFVDIVIASILAFLVIRPLQCLVSSHKYLLAVRSVWYYIHKLFRFAFLDIRIGMTVPYRIWFTQTL
jgi:hypothetical protein